MKCPTDEETLLMTERKGVEIDYCPRCRGVWLDRGELDKLIEKEAESFESEPSGRDREPDWDEGHRRPVPGSKRRKKGFLSEMFEFGD